YENLPRKALHPSRWAFDETRAKVRQSNPRSPSPSRSSRQIRDRGYSRLGNSTITQRTLRSHQSLIVPIFAQSVAPSMGLQQLVPFKPSLVTVKITHFFSGMTSGREITPPPSFSAIPITTTMFAVTTPENTPMAYRASTSANPNPVISLAFVEANYEALESLLRDRRERIVGFEGAQSRGESRVERNTEGGRPLEEAPRGNGGQSVNLPPLLAAHLGRGENGQPLQSSLTSAYRGQALPNNIGGNLPFNGTFLSHHAQPFIPASLSIPNGSMPIHVHPYQQPTSFINGQHLSFPTQTPLRNLPIGGIPAHLPQEGHAPQTFATSNMPS
ncbi:hypothetical protein Tco_1453769, partial [Tanacetum coccineum]